MRSSGTSWQAPQRCSSFRRCALRSSARLPASCKDSTGAVLPGVTVEAASPVLIEKTRTAVSDSAGQYKARTAAPGRVHRHLYADGLQCRSSYEGIEISAGFTAPVNASLEVGAVSETITVIGRHAGGGRADHLPAENASKGGPGCAADRPVVRDARDDVAGRDSQPARRRWHAGRTRKHLVGPRWRCV